MFVATDWVFFQAKTWVFFKTKSTGVQVTNATACNQSAEALKQTVASSQSIVLFKSDLQGRVFLVVELLGRSETEPAQAEPFASSWPPAAPTRTCVALW